MKAPTLRLWMTMYMACEELLQDIEYINSLKSDEYYKLFQTYCLCGKKLNKEIIQITNTTKSNDSGCSSYC